MKSFYFTCGDVNGIGPEIAIKTFNRIKFTGNRKIFFICPYNVFTEIAKKIQPNFDYKVVDNYKDSQSGILNLLTLPDIPLKIGEATKQSGRSSFLAVKNAFKFVIQDKRSVMITAPISKNAFKLAGVRYKGHTDLLADWCKTKNFLMTFLSKNMNAALSTIHIPLKKVSETLTQKKLVTQLKIIDDLLKRDLGISTPSVALLGLNPHAGEEGIIGDEEKKILIPLVNSLKGKLNISGPFSPDAFFASSMYKNYDMIFGMYHDQVLIPFKMLNFSSGVNFTAGLPIVRTSPDHGTAFDIAWQNKADESSLVQSYHYANKILVNRLKHDPNKKS